MDIFVGLDIGTTSARAIAVTPNGKIVASSSHEYPFNTPRPGWAEQSPDLWWKAAKQSLKKIAYEVRLKKGVIRGLGLTGQMHGLVCLDKRGHSLRKAILWCDQRTENECRKISRLVPNHIIVKKILNPPLTGFTAPKILWVRKHEPKLFSLTKHMLLPKDYIRYKLSGEFITDPSDASGTFLFDVSKRRWSTSVIKKLSIDPDMLPRVSPSSFISSTIIPSVALEIGFPACTPIASGAGDQAAGAVGCGIISKGIASSSLGTSGVIFAHLEKPIADKGMRTHTFCHAVPDKWHIMGVILSAGGSFRWLRDIINGFRSKKLISYNDMTRLAKKSPAGSNKCIFLPYLIGERTPYPDPRARGSFVGLDVIHKPEDLVRSVMEGITFAMRDSLEIFKQLNINLGEIRASGGGALSDLWCQIQSDIYNLPVKVLRADEGPAFGAALLSAVGTGFYSSLAEAASATIHSKKIFYPNKKNVVKYNDIYRVYHDLYGSLKDSFHRLSEVQL